MMFANSTDSHAHSLQTLNLLYEYDDFMASIRSMVDLGCGGGQDTEWWATRTTRDDNQEPLLIRCTGVDLDQASPFRVKYPNLTYQSVDFEEDMLTFPGGYDVLWCHDAFQYAANPLATLKLWWDIAEPGAMLVMILPQTTNIEYRKLSFLQDNFCYYHYSIVNLIHMLSVTGWDCESGFFKKSPNDNWLHAIVYKSKHAPMDPRTTSWYQLADQGLLPASAVESVQRHGFLKQQDLVLPWLDKNLTCFDQH